MYDKHIRRGHPFLFALLFVFSVIELSISAWLVHKFNTRHNALSSDTSARTKFILFASVWTIVVSVLLSVSFLVSATTSVLSSVASHLFFLSLTWIFWTAGAASITAALGGGLDCSHHFVYCGQLNALEGFAWLIWIFTTFALAIAIVRGIAAAKRGEGYRGHLVSPSA